MLGKLSGEETEKWEGDDNWNWKFENEEKRREEKGEELGGGRVRGYVGAGQWKRIKKSRIIVSLSHVERERRL